MNQVFAGVLGRITPMLKYIVNATAEVTLKPNNTYSADIIVNDAYIITKNNYLMDCTEQVNYVRANIVANGSGEVYAKSAEVFITSQNLTNFTLLNLAFKVIDKSEPEEEDNTSAIVGKAKVGKAKVGKA